MCKLGNVPDTCFANSNGMKAFSQSKNPPLDFEPMVFHLCEITLKYSAKTIEVFYPPREGCAL